MADVARTSAGAASRLSGGQLIRPCVMVPVHKPQPTPAEEVSLIQLGKTLKSAPILLVSPASIQTGSYHTLLSFSGEIRIDPRWMRSIAAYNAMMISPHFYSRFDGYTHMLVHEPDALVLRDELEYWCCQPYDYIGSPWLLTDSEGQVSLHPSHINGGFSLCNLSAMRRALSSWKRWHGLRVRSDLLAGLAGDLARLRRAILVLYPGGLLRGAYQLYPWNWDKFFYGTVAPLMPDFRLAPPEERLRFAWEFSCQQSMELTSGRLPFGLHAWHKYDFAYLRPYLLAAGVDLSPLER